MLKSDMNLKKEQNFIEFARKVLEDEYLIGLSSSYTVKSKSSKDQISFGLSDAKEGIFVEFLEGNKDRAKVVEYIDFVINIFGSSESSLLP